MNDDELRAALRQDDGIQPLDPAAVIAGAHRRRTRDLISGGAAAVAVLAVAAGGIVAANRSTTGAPVVPPVAGTSSPTPHKTPFSTPTSARVTPGPTGSALVTACRAALASAPDSPGSKAIRRAVHGGPEGELIIVADSKNWGACDTAFPGNDQPQVTARAPGPIQRPAVGDADAFAVANNQISFDTKSYEYYWAAGLMPTGVAKIRYAFPDGETADSVVFGKYWTMRHRSPQPADSAPLGQRIQVQLLAANGSVVRTFLLTWGTQTCAQITHGC